mgnify:CR=1 FL=1
MANFTYSTPFIHPKTYKDKQKGMNTAKWFIRYTFTKDGVTEYRKEYGKSYPTALNINYPKTHNQKIINAELLLDLVIDDLENGTDPKNRETEKEIQIKKEVAEAEKYKVSLIFDEWFKEKNYINPIPSKQISAKTYENFWKNQLIPYLATIGKADDMRSISDDDIRKWLQDNYNSGQWSALSTNIKIGYISNVFKYAYLKKYIPTNPMSYITTIKEDKVIVRDGISTIKEKKETRFNILTDDEIALFDEYFNFKTKTITKILMYGFIRFSEIYRLKLKHVDTVNWAFNIPSEIAKGQRDGATATVKIYPVLRKVIQEYLDDFFGEDLNPEYYLFYGEKNKLKSTSIDYISYQFKQTKLKIEKEKGIIIKKTPYSFKHTGAKKFVDQNKAKSKSAYEIIEAIMKMMRHTSFETSQIYIYKELGINLEANDEFSFD